MDTHLQRATDTLRFASTRIQIQQLHQSSLLIHQGNYNQAIKHFQDILLSLNQQVKHNAFYLEVRYHKIMAQLYIITTNQKQKQYAVNEGRIVQKCIKQFEELLDEIDQHEMNYLEEQGDEDLDVWDTAEQLRIRIYTSILQLSVKFANEINIDDWVDQLVDLLRNYMKEIPEVLGKICGCKYIVQFVKNFNCDRITNDTLKSYQQKAQLLDMAANWLIIGKQLDQGIKCKELAVSLWKKSNSLNQTAKSQAQLNQLRKREDSEFSIRLKRISKIITKITNVQKNQTDQSLSKSQSNLYTITKHSIGRALSQISSFSDNIEQFEDNRSNKQQGFWSAKKSVSSSNKNSILKNTKLSDYYDAANNFHKNIYLKQTNQQITSLLSDKSKFIRQQKKYSPKDQFHQSNSLLLGRDMRLPQ